MTFSSFLWNTTDLERETSDGFVFAASYVVTAIAEPYQVSVLGRITFERGEGDFIPYEELTPEIVAQWCKDHANTSAIEEQAQAELDMLIEAQTANGLPWQS